MLPNTKNAFTSLVKSDMHYTEALQLLKGTFLGGSEKEIVADEVERAFNKKTLSMLDVGTGNGRFLYKIVGLLQRRGLVPMITGIDPLCQDVEEFKKIFPAAKIACGHFEDYVADQQFDVVNASQSLYYLADLNKCLRRMIDLAAEGGVIMLTLWSEDCVMSGIHRDFFGVHNNSVTAEQVFAELKKFDDLEGVRMRLYSGSVNLKLWRKSPRVLSSALSILSRDLAYNPRMTDVRIFEDLISYYGDVEKRTNGVLVARKTSELIS